MTRPDTSMLDPTDDDDADVSMARIHHVVEEDITHN